MSRDELAGYWKKWYRPQNIVFVVVGDVKAAEVAGPGGQGLGILESLRLQACALSSEAPPKSLKLEEFTGDIETTMAIVGVPGRRSWIRTRLPWIWPWPYSGRGFHPA